jgi:hypothetical protein
MDFMEFFRYYRKLGRMPSCRWTWPSLCRGRVSSGSLFRFRIAFLVIY